MTPLASDRLSATFAALADPTRRAILARLESGEVSVTKLAEPFSMSLPAVSKHLKVLERAGLIARAREAQWRPCRPRGQSAQGVADWVAHYRRFFDESFDRLDDYLEELKKKEKKHARKQRKNHTGSNTADRELVIKRVFDAPRELVFAVWTDPEHVAQWWGPNGFSTTIQEMDVRPDGIWRLVMHGPDGTDYKNKIVFLEVVKPERLVYKHEPEEGTEPVTFETTVTFADRGDKTEITLRMLFPSAAIFKQVEKKYGAIEGAESDTRPPWGAFDNSGGSQEWRFIKVGGRELLIVRIFDAPGELVFKAWTKPNT